jgi:hypothetical protein
MEKEKVVKIYGSDQRIESFTYEIQTVYLNKGVKETL